MTSDLPKLSAEQVQSARDAAERAAGAQGLPLKVQDRKALEKVATLLRDGKET